MPKPNARPPADLTPAEALKGDVAAAAIALQRRPRLFRALAIVTWVVGTFLTGLPMFQWVLRLAELLSYRVPLLFLGIAAVVSSATAVGVVVGGGWLVLRAALRPKWVRSVADAYAVSPRELISATRELRRIDAPEVGALAVVADNGQHRLSHVTPTSDDQSE